MDTPKIPVRPPRKLTRQQIAEGLQSVPMQSILMGAANGKDKTLTNKQLRFAEALAMGDTKAGAYRKAYNTKGTPVTQSHEGSRLSASPAISAQVDAFKTALESQKYATPAGLRALVIERLTAAVLNPDLPPAQHLRALELLGKVSEIAAFTERREIIKVDSAGAARTKLLDSLRLAIQATAVDPLSGGASLLAELARRRPSDTVDAELIDFNEKSREIDDVVVSCMEPEPAADSVDVSVVSCHDVVAVDADANDAGNAAKATPPPPNPPRASGDYAQPLLSNPDLQSP